MPKSLPITLDHTNTLREFDFVSKWNGEDVFFVVTTRGGLRVRNLSDLTSETQAFLSRVINLAEVIEGSDDHDRLIQFLQTKIAGREGSLTTTLVRASAGIASRSQNTYDRYVVSTDARLPGLFSRVIPSVNIFMILLSALLLLPGASTNQVGLFTSLSISSLAMMAHFFSDSIQHHLGDRSSLIFQDIFTLATLSITSFSSLRTILSIALGRSLEISSVSNPNADYHYANYIGGAVIIALASLGTIGAWFSPPISVMGQRVQSMAIQLEEACLGFPTVRNVARREAIISNFSRADTPFAYRFFCPSRAGRTPEFNPFARVIEPPTLIVTLTRLGGAFVRSSQLARSLVMNQHIFASILLPLAGLGLLHSYVSREQHLVAGSRTLIIPALSSYAPLTARRFKLFSELSSVSYNSMINPTIAYFFVFKKLLDYQRENTAFLSFDSLALLALAVVINTFSLMLDLSSRRLGIDRFDGWTRTQLRRIITEAETASIRGNLGEYLQTLIQSTHHSITLPEEVSTARAGRELASASGPLSIRMLMP